MLVQKLAQGMLIHFTTDELSRKGLNAQTVDKKSLLPLIERALQESAQLLPRYPEIQLFQSDCELLVFVRPYLSEKNHFSLHNAFHS